jgi:hypothetical protein
MDLGFVLLTGLGIAVAVVLSVAVGTLTARLFFRASSDRVEDLAETKREAVR